MHILLTDRLTCPRCGPEFGLILLAEHIQDRRVLEGEIGCANCRERFLVRNGFCELTWPSRPEPESGKDAAPDVEDPESALRVAALLGITGGPGHVLLMGASVRHAGPLADLIPDVEWIAADGSAARLSERNGVSRIGASPERLPFFSGVFRGAVLEGAVLEGADQAGLAEAIRVLMSTARMVLIDPPGSARALLEDSGFQVVLDDGTTLVAAALGAGSGVASFPPRN